METPFGLPTAREFEQTQAPSRARYVFSVIFFAFFICIAIWGLQYFFDMNLSKVQAKMLRQKDAKFVQVALGSPKSKTPEVITAPVGSFVSGFPVGFLLKETKFSILSSQKIIDGSKVSYVAKLKSSVAFDYVQSLYTDFFRKYGYKNIKSVRNGSDVNISAEKDGAFVSILDQAMDGGSLITINYKTP